MSQQLNQLGEIAKNAAPNSFAAMFAESIARQEMRAGEVITAEVLRVDQNHVVVNAGLKSESFIPIEEFFNDQGGVDVKEGDFVSVAIEALEDDRGETRLSRDRAKRLAAWVSLEQALEIPHRPHVHLHEPAQLVGRGDAGVEGMGDQSLPDGGEIGSETVGRGQRGGFWLGWGGKWCHAGSLAAA